ncbi:MAG: hypothetical protein OXH13_05590 [Chloroflexi bacterium]|nr:hypothetical protein [Chloroflexota bacterium]MCY3696281.1 hypothetical protein [Chloroflexota bacterium]
MADTTAQRWMRLMGGQGRPTARPPSDADVAETVSRYPERAAQALVEQSRALGQAASARQARGWITGQLDEAANLLDQATRDRIGQLADAQIAQRLPEDSSNDG